MNWSRSRPARISSAAWTMASAIAAIEPAERGVGARAGLLDEHGGGDERRRRLEPADREVVDGALGLHPVVRVGGNVQLAEGIALERASRAFDPRGHLPSIILLGMLASFFDSLVQLITRTSTDLPPDVREGDGRGARDRGAGDPRRAGADDHRAEHRPGGELRGPHLPGHRHADLRDQGAGRRQPDLDEAAGPARRSPKRPGAASCGRTRSTRSPARTPATTSARARRSSTSSSGSSDDDRGEADPEGGRLREHQRAVLAAGGSRSSRPRRSHARRRPQVHPPRGVEGAGQGLQPGLGRRVRRRRSHVGLPAREGAAVPHARRHQPGPAARRRSRTR